MLKKDVEFMLFDEYVLVEKSLNAKKGKYLVRNFEMIKKADICIFYFDDDYFLKPLNVKHNMIDRKKASGTKRALYEAKRLGKEIINIF